MNLTIANFSGIYENQPFIKSLQKNFAAQVFDFSNLSGTNCYLDSETERVITETLASISYAGIHFNDSGNFHYMSKIWTQKIQTKFNLILFDHHPDMQEARFEGVLSCGSWLREVFKSNPFLQNIFIIGVADSLVSEIPQGVHFIPESERDILTKVSSFRFEFPSYVSIDKDVFNTNVARTNWDQGALSFESFQKVISLIAKKNRFLGFDICGEREANFENFTADDFINNELNQKIFHLLKNFAVSL